MMNPDELFQEYTLRQQTNCDFHAEEIIVPVERVFDVVRELVDREPSERWLVWCEQSRTIQRVVAVFGHRRVETAGGNDTARNRVRVFSAFKSGDVDTLVLLLHVGSVGVDLRPCRRNVFVDPSAHTWRERNQAIMRTDRRLYLGAVDTYFVFGQVMLG